ncbi:vWA domain-containing protein [Mariniblastus fucicola]|uniref:vWA domain-containing protein n=1 Tax=Mariniblastus fucicola TaxID=980251 RepID=UPI00143DC8C4|nr:VWA domain-containing protein [Mariniblastus fucicola]
MKHDEIRVEELVNYHRHQIALPAWDKRIGLDVRSGKMNDGKHAFQIGLATHRDIVEEFRIPLNLVLVIDRSGSMSGNRIAKVKTALVALMNKLSPKDLVSIVTYSDDAKTCLEGTRVLDLETIKSAITRIQTGGSTNLNTGLMLGYKVAEDNFDSERANRVILLTDGIANRGVTDEAQIARESKKYNDREIGLSTIGLGSNFNQSLLRELADAGRGAIHFVADVDDIQKVFVDEFDSLLSPAAMDVTLTIRFPEVGKLPKIFGYQPEKLANGYRVPLENMSYGATQVVVGKFGSRKPTKIDVELTYFNSCTKKRVRFEQSIQLKAGESDRVLKKNYAIAKVANSVKQSAKLVESSKHQKAYARLSESMFFARMSFEPDSDPDVDRICDIAQQQICGVLRLAVADK